MENLEKLYDAFGELIYAVAMADGIIQKEEVEALEKILAKHPWANEIKWSFDYELSKNNSVDELYNKVVAICHMIGPRKEYDNLIAIITEIAEASNGIDEKESAIISNFSKDLIARFQHDLNIQ